MARPWNEIGRYGGVGIDLVLAILLLGALGHWLDGKYWPGHDYGLLSGGLLGVGVGVRNLVRAASRMQADIERAERNDPLAGKWNVDESWLHPPAPPSAEGDAAHPPDEPDPPMTPPPADAQPPSDGGSSSEGPDPRLRNAIRAVAWTGAGLTAASLPVFGGRAAIAVAAGGVLATANLVALAQIVGALLPSNAAGAQAQSRAGWALLAVLKMAALFVACWILLRQANLPPLGVVAGFGALPIGVAIGSLVSDRRGA